MAVNDKGTVGETNILIEENVTAIGGGAARASWGAIFAGAICALAIYLVLGMIGLAAGIGVIDPAEEANPVSGVPTGVGIWWLVSAIAAFFVGGLIAGRLAGWPKDITGAIHGLTVGSITLLFISYLAASAIGSAVTGAAGALSGLMSGPDRRNIMVTVRQPQLRALQNAIGEGSSGTGNVAAENTPRQPIRRPGSSDAQWDFALSSYLLYQVANSIRDEASGIFRELVSKEERQQATQAVQATFSDLIESPGDAGRDMRELFEVLLGNDGVLGAEDRRTARRILIDRLGLEPRRADIILDRWQQRYEEAVDNLQTLVNDAQHQLSDLAKQGTQAVEETASEARSAYRSVVSRSQQRETAKAVEQTIDRIIASPSNAGSDLQQLLDRLFGQNGIWTKEDLAEVRTLLKNETGLSENDIEKLLTRWQQRYQNAVSEVNEAYQVAQHEVAEAVDTSLDTIAATAGWATLALILALAASTIGGLLGRPVVES
ncbi:MAG: TIGR04086 family membrane protein [Alphaproteobacteria bacterium]|nr:TIGR04086 family membrane protein [Alphaproteobacteria bacterium]